MIWVMVLSMQAAMAEEPVATLSGESKPPEELMRALSVREGAPSCQDLQAMTETPVAHLRWVVSNVTMPPWAGMRAAECLVRSHGADIAPQLRQWVTDPGYAGLKRIVMGNMDVLPRALATELAGLGEPPRGTSGSTEESDVGEGVLPESEKANHP